MKPPPRAPLQKTCRRGNAVIVSLRRRASELPTLSTLAGAAPREDGVRGGEAGERSEQTLDAVEHGGRTPESIVGDASDSVHR